MDDDHQEAIQRLKARYATEGKAEELKAKGDTLNPVGLWRAYERSIPKEDAQRWLIERVLGSEIDKRLRDAKTLGLLEDLLVERVRLLPLRAQEDTDMSGDQQIVTARLMIEEILRAANEQMGGKHRLTLETLEQKATAAGTNEPPSRGGNSALRG